VYPHQQERLAEAREKVGADVLVASSPANVAYMTGYWSLSRAVYPTTAIYAVLAPAGIALVVPAIDVAHVMAADVDVAHVACYGEFHVDGDAAAVRAVLSRATADPAHALASALDALGVRAGTLGLDDAPLPAAAAAALAQRLRGFAVRSCSEALASARVVKSPYEIECLQSALHIAEEATLAVLDALHPGVTEREAVAVYASEIARRGAEAYCTIIAVGPNAAVPAPFPSARAVRMGDVIRIDLGCVFKGYKSDLARTAVMGEPRGDAEARYEAIHAGLEAGIDAIAPGVDAGAVFDALVKATRSSGLPEYRRHHVGHGIGLEVAESPWLSPGGPVLEPGMVVRVEAPYYALGDSGMNVKDTVLVTQKGGLVMNRSHRGLVVLD
jgi:Xaa-Pro aminopeptidase